MDKRHFITTGLVLMGIISSSIPALADHSLWINIAANLWWIWLD
jgi:hypothetical protein